MNTYNFIINNKIIHNNEKNIKNEVINYDVINYNELIKTVTNIRNFDNILWKYLNKGRLIIYNYYGLSSDNNISQDYIKNINKYLKRISKNISKISKCYSYNFDIYYIFRLYNLKRYNKYLVLGPNSCNVESIIYYNKSSKISYIKTDSQLENENNEKINNIINNKNIKNINITNFNNLKKYDCIIFNIMITYITTYEEYLDYKTMKDIELQNIKEFEKAYELLDNLEINGTLILYTSTIITKEVLLILENISICFENTFLYKTFSSTYKIIQWVVIIFENFKDIKKKKKYNSANFILSIKNFYDDNLKIYNTIVNNYNYLFSIRNNNTLFEYIMDNNLLFSYEIYKYLQFPAVNINKLELKIIKSKLNYLFNIDNNLLNFDTIKYSNHEFIINYNYIKITEIEDIHKELLLLNNLINDNKHIINNEIIIFNSLKLKLLNRDKYWINLYEILKITNIIKNKDNILFLSDNYTSLLDATKYYCNSNNLEFAYIQSNINIIDGDEIKKYKEICKNTNLIIVECNMKKYTNKILAYYAQILFILNNTKKNANAIIKFKLYFNKNIIFNIVYILRLSFENIYFYRPSIITYDKFYIICQNRNNYTKNLDSLFNILNNQNIDFKIFENYNMNYLSNFIFNYKILINNYTNNIYANLYFSNYWNILNEINKNIINKFIINKVKDWKLKFFNNVNNNIQYKSFIKNMENFIYFANKYLEINIKPYITDNELKTFINIRKNIKKKKESIKSFDNIKILLKDIKINNNIFVDIGCGSGVLTNLIKKEYNFNETYCFETNNYINPNFNKINIEIIKNSNINLPTNNTDLILCNLSLHHIKDFDKMLSEIIRILKPKGYFIIYEHDKTNNKQIELLDYYHVINYLLLVDCKNEDFETLYFRFINDYYSNYTSKEELINQLSKYFTLLKTKEIYAGFVNNYYALFQKK